MKKFIIKNMGCKSNQFEGAIMRENLLNNGFIEVDKISEADYFILNSCSVTHKSDNEALYIMRNARHENPNAKNILTGCVAQIEKFQLLENPAIDSILGNDEKLDIAKYINEESAVNDIMTLDSFHKVELTDMTKTRASLKIQDGCDNRCSYCIIPFGRGKNRSADPDFIIEQIQNFENIGFKEVVFTGIHIGQWGKDFGKSLIDLLKIVEEKTSIRYRLGSLNPLEINDELLSFLAGSKQFCPHFHMSLQSACNNTLRRMNRFYKVEDYLKLLEKISQIFKNPFIGSDIIAGFVGETEDDFNITLDNLKLSKLTQIHTFPYSIRKGTAAEKMTGHLDDKIKEFRAKKIKEVSAQKLNEFLNRNIDTVHDVLLEKHFDKKTGFLKGVSENYITVIVESKDSSLLNTMQKVCITKIDNGRAFGILQ